MSWTTNEMHESGSERGGLIERWAQSGLGEIVLPPGVSSTEYLRARNIYVGVTM